MGVYLFVMDKLLEVLSNGLYILSDLFYIKFSSIMLLAISSIELDQARVVKIADLLKAGLK